LSRSEETRTEVVVSRGDWEGLFSSLESLMTLHQRTLQRPKDLRIRNEALRTEQTSALALPTVKARPEKGASAMKPLVAVQRCRYCNREMEVSAKFCDNCGNAVGVSICQCGHPCLKDKRTGLSRNQVNTYTSVVAKLKGIHSPSTSRSTSMRSWLSFVKKWIYQKP